MSSRKHPLTELRQPPSKRASRSMPNTPSRYAPSTPHALRALQQRSAGKTRSARTVRTLKNRTVDGGQDVVRPDSARGILRRLAKITAQTAKSNDARMRALSGVVGKENIQPEEDDGDDWEREEIKKPQLTLDVEDESLDFDVNDLPLGYDEEEDSELLPAPTPSVLPDDDDNDDDTRGGGHDRSVTFKTIDFANEQGRAQPNDAARRKSRVSFAQLRSEADGDDDDENDATMLTERGRKAVSEDMTGRFSRYSFGSIRMSDFGDDLEVRRDSDPRFQANLENTRKSLGAPNDVLLEGETELLNRLTSSIPPSPVGEDEDEGPGIGDDDDFQLFVPEDDEMDAFDATAPQTAGNESVPPPVESVFDEAGAGPIDHHEATTNPPRRLTSLEVSTGTSEATKRRKRQKLTRHGALIPSLPSSLIKRIATETSVRNGRRRPQLGKDHMKALEQATEWFFEQVGEDLAAYAQHGKRKKNVDTTDVRMLMRRQRVDLEDVRKLAEEVLPPEVARELDLEDKED